MPVPKRRQSRSRRDRRRSHDALTPATIINCSNCSEPNRPHFVCAKCGYYKGKKIIELKKAE